MYRSHFRVEDAADQLQNNVRCARAQTAALHWQRHPGAEVPPGGSEALSKESNMTADQRRKARWVAIRSGIVLGLVSLTACGDRVREFTKPDDSGVNRQYVVGAAAAALDANGQFKLTARRTWKRPELTEGDARRLALLYIRKFPRTNAAYYEELHGAAIDFDELYLCGRVFYAMSPYEDPDSSMPEGMVNAIASHWLFTFCRPGGIPVISTALAATATRLDFSDPSTQRGSEIFSIGIPAGKTGFALPERAVEQLATASGHRVSTVPELVQRGLGTAPQSAQWRLGLDGPVSATDGAGTRIQRVVLYVGRALRSWDIEIYDGTLASAGDPAEEVRDRDGRVYFLVRAGNMPRAFVRVQVLGGNAP